MLKGKFKGCLKSITDHISCLSAWQQNLSDDERNTDDNSITETQQLSFQWEVRFEY